MTRREGAALGALVAFFALLLFVEGASLPTAWLPLEEAPALEHARGHGGVTGAEGVLYPAVLAPVARSLSPSAAFRFAQAVSALLTALTAIPAFLLARRRVPFRASLVVAALSVLAPASAYATAAVPDALALLLAISSLALLVRASESESAIGLFGALVLAVAAALARPWFLLLPPALLVAYELARPRRRSFLRWPRSLVFAAFAAFAYLVLAAIAPEAGDALAQPGDVARWALASLAVAAVGLGVVPWLLAASGSRIPRLPETALLATCLPALVFAAGVFGTVAGGIEERPLLALVPLVLTLAALVWIGGVTRLGAVVLAGAVLVFAALALPALGRAPVGRASGLSLLTGDGRSRTFLVVTGAALVVVGVALVAGSRRRPMVLVAAVLLFVAASHAATWTSVRGEARALDAAELLPRGWVDRHAGTDAEVYVAGPPEARDDRSLAQLVLWNKSIRGFRELDVAPVDPKTGLITAPDIPFALERGVQLVGKEIARSPAGTLVQTTGQPQLLETVEGLYADGWSGEQAVYRRFAGSPRPGKLVVTVSRAAWRGADRPGEASISTGPLDGEVQERGKVVIHAGEEREVEVGVPPAPFQVVVAVRPTFSPAEFGAADERQLGAQLRFDYRPGS